MSYGLISKVDAACIEKTLDLIISENRNSILGITEIGLFNCETIDGIYRYIRSKGAEGIFTGIDNEKDKPIEHKQFFWLNFIKGNSNEVYNQIEDNSQHFILIDGNHSYPYVISDYYCYKNKVKEGGYLCFHDTSPQAQGKDWQRMGSKDDSDMCIAVEKALKDIGLLPTPRYLPKNTRYWMSGWQLVFDEYDTTDQAGGVCIFKKTI